MSLIALAALGIYSSSVFGAAVAAQGAVSFAVPVVVMIVFWRAARARLHKREAELGLERVTNRATEQFLAAVSHELTPHLERCSLISEALVVAVEYQEVGADIKVAVPDIAVDTDPHMLRQILHVLVGNAVRHGGRRVAIWAVTEGDFVRLSVSDDGPGLPDGAGARVFDRYVDLAEQARTAGRSGTGIAVLRGVGEHIGAEFGYKRDPSWTHFSVRLPLASAAEGSPADRVPLEAGVR